MLQVTLVEREATPRHSPSTQKEGLTSIRRRTRSIETILGRPQEAGSKTKVEFAANSAKPANARSPGAKTNTRRPTRRHPRLPGKRVGLHAGSILSVSAPEARIVALLTPTRVAVLLLRQQHPTDLDPMALGAHRRSPPSILDNHQSLREAGGKPLAMVAGTRSPRRTERRENTGMVLVLLPS